MQSSFYLGRKRQSWRRALSFFFTLIRNTKLNFKVLHDIFYEKEDEKEESQCQVNLLDLVYMTCCIIMTFYTSYMFKAQRG